MDKRIDPVLERKENYIPLGLQEEFIVPLLEKEILSALKIYLDTPNKLTVLDIGCGNQPFSNIVKSMNNDYFSFDIDNNVSSYNIDFLGRIDKELPYLLKQMPKFDFILLTEVLEHVPEWNMTFNNLKELVKPGGHILITAPFIYHLHEVPHDYWRPTEYAVSFYSEKYDFEIVQYKKLGNFWDVLGTIVADTRFIEPSKYTYKNMIVARLIRIFKKFLIRILKSRYLQQNIDISSNLYLSNFIILRSK